MQHSQRVSVSLSFVVAAMALWALAPVAGQAPAGIARPWTMARTADGHPDIQGNWTNATITPIDRPQGAPAVLHGSAGGSHGKGLRRPRRTPGAAERPQSTGPAPGRRRLHRRGRQRRRLQQLLGRSRRPDCRRERRAPELAHRRSARRAASRPSPMPPARARPSARRRFARAVGEYDHPEFRPLAERCLMSFGSNAGPPMLPNYFYNNNYQIVQTQGSRDDRHRDGARRADDPSECHGTRPRTSDSGWAIRSAAGRATPWWSRPPTSTRSRPSAGPRTP